MTREQLLAKVNQVCDEIDAPGSGPDSRFHEVEELLSAIDWGRVPTPTIRAVLTEVVKQVPMRLLTSNPSRERTFAETVRGTLDFNAKMRAEDEAERADELAPRKAA